MGGAGARWGLGERGRKSPTDLPRFELTTTGSFHCMRKTTDICSLDLLNAGSSPEGYWRGPSSLRLYIYIYIYREREREGGKLDLTRFTVPTTMILC